MKKACTALILAAACLPGLSKEVRAEEHIWTLDADFDEGTIINLNHDPNHDQLQLNNFAKPFRFINVPASARGTVVRVDTDTGEIVGEYKTAPEFRGLNPSRTTVDIYGNVWTGNRGEVEDEKGSVVKIGIVIGGTRCNADGTDNPDGEYVRLDPDKLTYNTCVDRNGDGLIRTSKGLGDIRPWPDNTDGAGGADGIVEDAEDECILIYQRLPGAPGIRHVSVDRENNVWIGGHPPDDDGHYYPTMFYKLNGNTGAIVDSFDASEDTGFGCGGYGGTIVNNNFDQLLGNDILWSASVYQDKLLRYDLSTGEGRCIEVEGSYGIGIDNDGFIWNSMHWPNTITKINPDTGSYEPGFPVDTGGKAGRGVAVTADNTVWSANTNSNTVTRLDSDGNLLATIEVGTAPTGLSVDKAGKIWVTNRESDNIMRINPATNAVDLTVDLGEGAGPYNYSDMTGSVRLSHPPMGFWDVVYDGGCNTLWDRISWNGQEDAVNNGEIIVQVRAATKKAMLASVPFTTVSNGAALTGMKGQFIEVRTTLTTEAPVGDRDLPVLRDLTLEYSELDMTVDIPDLKYSFGFAPFDLDDYITFDPTGDWYDDVIWSHSPVPEGWNVTIDENNVVTVTCPEDETEDVFITFSARLSWDNEECIGAEQEVLFEANHPPVLCDVNAFQCIPKNNKKMFPVPLTGFVCDPDGDPVTVEILSITSDEPTLDKPTDKFTPDADPDCIGTDVAWVRQERDAHGDGRVYVVTFIARDGRGGETEMSLPLKVPHDNNGDCVAVDSGQQYDATEISSGGGNKKKK
ncbi:MAG: hypothetical protein D3915_03995 [Candidatus Electrothrix sp. AU1_5]|nr:hypothetical protein [Candidatus Electrothrix gigas]